MRSDELMKAFGWSRRERSSQQDSQEFAIYLFDYLEKAWKAKDDDGHLQERQEVARKIEEMMFGQYKSIIKCKNVDFKSERNESFHMISLRVETGDLISAFRE